MMPQPQVRLERLTARYAPAMDEPREEVPQLRGAPKLVMGILRRVSPKHADAAERESREWLYICSECGTARSVRSLGGIRYKAKSKGKRVLMGCPTCGEKHWHAVERRT